MVDPDSARNLSVLEAPDSNNPAKVEPASTQMAIVTSLVQKEIHKEVEEIVNPYPSDRANDVRDW